MANLDKKRAKIQERIQDLETQMKTALQKKDSGTAAFDVPGATRQIAKLREELKNLK
jgi:ribosome-interacting GTPase 1